MLTPSISTPFLIAHFFQLQREKAKKPVQLDEQAAAECRRVLSAFFAEMTQWEQYMEPVSYTHLTGQLLHDLYGQFRDFKLLFSV